MIVSPHCNKYNSAIRLLTDNHCSDKSELECESGKCEYFEMRLYALLGY